MRDNIVSRRNFFKRTYKVVLPIIGTIICSTPILAKAPEKIHMGCKVSYYDAGPSSHCSTCYGSCKQTCEAGCSKDCTGNCSGDCVGTCNKSCLGSCEGTCAGSCQGTCAGSCKNSCSRSSK